MLKAVLFDLDGTLVNHTGALRAALAGLYRRVGEPAGVGFCAFKEVWERESDHQYQRYLAGELTFTGQRIARIRAILALAGHEVTDDGAMEVFRSYNVDYEAAWRLFDDVLPCLDNLGGYRLGVITNGDAGPQRLKLERCGILPRFAKVVVSSEAGAAKPDPRIFALMLEQLGVEPFEAVMIGDDQEKDVRGAWAAGLRAVWLRRDLPEARENCSNDDAIGSLLGLPEMLRGLNGTRICAG